MNYANDILIFHLNYFVISISPKKKYNHPQNDTITSKPQLTLGLRTISYAYISLNSFRFVSIANLSRRLWILRKTITQCLWDHTATLRTASTTRPFSIKLKIHFYYLRESWLIMFRKKKMENKTNVWDKSSLKRHIFAASHPGWEGRQGQDYVLHVKHMQFYEWTLSD